MIGPIRVVERNSRAAGSGDTNFRFAFDPDEVHNEDVRTKRLPGALGFL